MKNIELRPKIHATAPKNWINDPNGMVYVDGKYHLFYQYYPDEPVWGPMHWGHVVSEDLLHWEHLPIALYPDELGAIFSGSCVLDVDNVSGLGTKDKPAMIAVYTSHNMKNGQEQQSIAYSTDYVHFEKYYGNPVIANTEKKDFRDPKVFWNPVKNCYSLVLAAGDHVEFYASKDLKKWEKTGEFKAGEHGYSGICECPDCFPLMTEDGEKWVLFISMILPEAEVGVKNDVYDRQGHITQYYVGTFDGDTFYDTEQAENPLLLDYGTDNYAAVTFQNLEEKVMIGWANSWTYANLVPTVQESFRGMMTIARRMNLVKTQMGYRLSFTMEGLDFAKAGAIPLKQGTNRLLVQEFGIKVNVESEGSIILSNRKGERIILTITDEEICLDRRMAGQADFSENYQKDSMGLTKTVRVKKNSEIDIVFDHSIIEVIADDGLIPITASVFPTSQYEVLTLEGIGTAEIYRL